MTESAEKIFRGGGVDALIAVAECGFVVIDAVGSIIYCDAAAEKIFNIRLENVKNTSVDCLIPERFRRLHNQHLRNFNLLTEPRILGRPVSGLRSDNTEFPAEIGVMSWEVGGARYFVAAVRDLTHSVELTRIATRQVDEIALMRRQQEMLEHEVAALKHMQSAQSEQFSMTATAIERLQAITMKLSKVLETNDATERSLPSGD